jgi:hypothetical protein
MDKEVTFVWNDVSVVPDDIEQPVHICPNFEHPVSDWKNMARKYHITLWVYQSCLTGEHN